MTPGVVESIHIGSARRAVLDCVDAVEAVEGRGLAGYLESLIGRRFRIGGAILLGVRAAHPCAYLESLGRRGLRDALAGRGGLRADVVAGGRIAVGDRIELPRR